MLSRVSALCASSKVYRRGFVHSESKNYREVEVLKSPEHLSGRKQVWVSAAAADTDPCQLRRSCIYEETSSGRVPTSSTCYFRSSILPLVMRDTSSKSSISRVTCRTCRSITSLAHCNSGEGGPFRRRICAAFRMGARGLRSSWASIARNSSLRCRPNVLDSRSTGHAS